MSWLPLVFLAGCVWACWKLSGTASELAAQVRDLRYQVARLKGEANDDREGTKVLRAHVAALAAGQRVPREQVLSGRFYTEISALEAYDRFRRTPPPALLDVRTGEEWMVDHAAGATLVLLDELEKRMGELPPKETPLLVICASGGRSLQAAEFLASQGWTDVASVQGGTPAWPGPHETRNMMKLAYSPPKAG
jgi:rhodanese-related sulfurtransferase